MCRQTHQPQLPPHSQTPGPAELLRQSPVQGLLLGLERRGRLVAKKSPGCPSGGHWGFCSLLRAAVVHSCIAAGPQMTAHLHPKSQITTHQTPRFAPPAPTPDCLRTKLLRLPSNWFPGDTTVLGLNKDDNYSVYRNVVSQRADWCAFPKHQQTWWSCSRTSRNSQTRSLHCKLTTLQYKRFAHGHFK